MQVKKCHICGCRPATTEKGYCSNCQAQIEADKRRKQQPKPFKYVTYKGMVISFLQGKGDTLKPTLSGKDPEKLPAKITINLDKYCPGYTRNQVKKLKRLCLSFAK